MLESLVYELKRANVGSEELDVAITKFLCHFRPDEPPPPAMEWTRSLDAALSLVPEEMQWAMFWIDGRARCKMGHPGLKIDFETGSPALALCMAALKAVVLTRKRPIT